MKFRFSHVLCINTFIFAGYWFWECFFTPWGSRVLSEMGIAITCLILAAIFWALVFIKEDSWIHKGIEVSRVAQEIKEKKWGSKEEYL